MAYTTINKSTDYFNTKLYTGNGSNNHAITGVGFAPDLVWAKRRDGSNGHVLFDKVRGATKILQSDTASAEITSASGKDTVSLDSDGFTVAVPAQTGGINPNGASCVAWNWKGGGSGSTNNDGSTASVVSANTTAGFSIVTHAGTGSATTIGHGLGAAPKVIITKGLNVANSWIVQQNILGGSWTSSNYFYLNSASTAASSSALINNVSTSTISFAGSDSFVNGSYNYVHYCFAEKTGYSKFGSYTGNGNADGPFIYTGFKPAWLMIVNTSSTQNRVIFDNKRDPFNVMDGILYPNSTDGEQTQDSIDFLSNGFKLRVTGNDRNGSGNTLFFMAFAEAPIVGTNNIPCTAR